MFKFNLQNVLDIREKAERQLASQLVEAISVEQEAKDELSRLETTLNESAQRLASQGISRSAGELMTFNYLIQHLNIVIQDANQAVEDAEQAVTEVTEKLQVAFKDRRVLDRLKEKQNDQYKSLMVHTERQSMDELAVLRFCRGND